MGGLIPIGQGADAEIKARLNKTFSGNNLAVLKANVAAEDLFNPGNRRLHRVAFRLGCYPIGPDGERSRQKWFYFLKTTLKNSSIDGGKTNTHDAIQRLLRYALTPANNVKSVVFDAVESTEQVKRQHFVHPDNVTPQVVQGQMQILLICPAPLDPTLQLTTPDQDPDPNERPLPI